MLLMSHILAYATQQHRPHSRVVGAPAVSGPADPGGWNTGQRRRAQEATRLDGVRRPGAWAHEDERGRVDLALEAAQLMARPGSNTFLFPSRKRGLHRAAPLYLMST
jgi:hypothetical protein